MADPQEPRADNPGIFVMLQSNLEKTTQQAALMAELRRDVQDVTTQIQGLTRILRGDGNGEKGLVTRILLVERALGESNNALVGLKETLDKRNVEDLKGRWSIAQSAVVAIGTLLTAIISALLLRLISGGVPVPVPPHR